MTTDEEFDRLTAYEARITAIMKAVEVEALDAPQVKQLQQDYRSLKNDLLAEVKTRTLLEDVAKEAISHLATRVNTHPIKSNWTSGLWAAQMDIGHELDRLRRKRAK